MTVHIVEDDPGVLDALIEYCRSAGRAVKAYGDGGSFCRQSDVKASDVVLVDLMLPDMTGAEVLRNVRRRFPGTRMVVISGLPSFTIDDMLREFAGIPVVRKSLTSDLVGLLRRRV
jgi:DNA-binding response OmpR family regulator